MFPAIILFFVRLFFRIFTRISFEGKENLPFEGGTYIITANHLGRLDAFLVYNVFSRTDLIVMVAEKYYENPVSRWIGNQMDVIWIDRYNADFRALRKVYNRLQKGGLLVMAPEGTRSSTRSLLPGHHGAAYLAAKAQVPIIPVALCGSEDQVVIDRLRHFKRVELQLKIGPAYTLPPLPRKNREAALQTYTDEIMCQIAALLPADYRGVYAEHPRLLALLSGERPALVIE